MKKMLLPILCFMLLPAQLIAYNDMDVRFTAHNLAYNTDPSQGLVNNDNTRNIFANNPGANEVCAFCHTPHNASPAVPLWNKASGAVYSQPDRLAYQLYTSSGTSSGKLPVTPALTANSESLLCLGCHDGKTAINVLHNSRYRDATTADSENNAIIQLYGADPIEMTMGDYWVGGAYPSDIGATRNTSGNIASGPAAHAGTNLTDDHPIGFSYSASEIQNSGKFNDPVTARNRGIRLYGPDMRVECSSCHNPHVFYGQYRYGSARKKLANANNQAQLDRTPFLVRDNNGSALCLACHIK